MQSLCKCCASNMQIFPLVLCSKEPYGEEIPMVKKCDNFITEEQTENVLNIIYKYFTPEAWKALSREDKNAIRQKYKDSF